ncbi:MAG: efflux RND transporter periplasmic adaptor subunit [Pseudanabaenaceae cyanobacterium SKYGB_i_bin29]|nr:efflux RND transporter periplasmic adaptor subunit [Pseudanabaenaceae cyanobacterium SKYG29]MDW8421658.1 efflux RND transporter periplasmic adaptor subunit [Pseudanabaenaceae cyanobacterium SKYGB_i_bin29]
MKKWAILAAVFLTACASSANRFPSGPVAVETSGLVLGTIEDTSDFIAALNSRQSVALKPRVAGQVTQILVRQGDTVKEGTTLLVIDPSQQLATVESNAAQVQAAQAEVDAKVAALASAEAAYESAKALLSSRQALRSERVAALNLQQRDVQRDRELFKEGVISQRLLEVRLTNLQAAEAALQSLDREIEAQQANVKQAEARVLQATADLNAAKQRLQQFQSNKRREEVQLEFHQVSAPFPGQVGNIPVKVGDFVNTATELLTITQGDQLEVEIAVPVDRASQLKEGLPVKILGEQNQPIGEGNIFFISPTVTPQSQSVLVKAVIDNQQGLLRQNQFVRVRIVWSSRPGVKVPVTAISRQAGKNFVYVLETKVADGKTKTIARQRMVELGKIVQNNQEVLNGLQPQDTVITKGIQFLTDGAEVIVGKDQS